LDSLEILGRSVIATTTCDNQIHVRGDEISSDSQRGRLE
jgi:hypothetical protein